jgi:AcrR family transcriptional regulator
MPRLWNATIEAHRRDVRDAILDTTAALAAEHGVLSVTMSQIAEETGIGRATLYKYFPDVQSILHAWHERQIAGHLAHLTKVEEHGGSAGERLEAVLAAYALGHHERAHHHRQEPHGAQLGEFLHQDEQLAQPRQQLHDMVRRLLTEAAASGDVRDDVAPGELATFCLHALDAARHLPSKAAIRRLVTVTLAGLQPTSRG